MNKFFRSLFYDRQISSDEKVTVLISPFNKERSSSETFPSRSTEVSGIGFWLVVMEIVPGALLTEKNLVLR